MKRATRDAPPRRRQLRRAHERCDRRFENASEDSEARDDFFTDHSGRLNEHTEHERQRRRSFSQKSPRFPRPYSLPSSSSSSSSPSSCWNIFLIASSTCFMASAPSGPFASWNTLPGSRAPPPAAAASALAPRVVQHLEARRARRLDVQRRDVPQRLQKCVGASCCRLARAAAFSSSVLATAASFSPSRYAENARHTRARRAELGVDAAPHRSNRAAVERSPDPLNVPKPRDGVRRELLRLLLVHETDRPKHQLAVRSLREVRSHRGHRSPEVLRRGSDAAMMPLLFG